MWFFFFYSQEGFAFYNLKSLSSNFVGFPPNVYTYFMTTNRKILVSDVLPGNLLQLPSPHPPPRPRSQFPTSLEHIWFEFKKKNLFTIRSKEAHSSLTCLAPLQVQEAMSCPASLLTPLSRTVCPWRLRREKFLFFWFNLMRCTRVSRLWVFAVQFSGSFPCPLRSFPESQWEGTQNPLLRFTHCAARLWLLNQHFTFYQQQQNRAGSC